MDDGQAGVAFALALAKGNVDASPTPKLQIGNHALVGRDYLEADNAACWFYSGARWRRLGRL